MAETVNKESVIKKKKAPVKPTTTRTKTMFVIGVAIILIPLVIVLVIIGGDALGGRKPIIKDRYNNDLDPAITKDNMKSIEDDVLGLPGVEGVVVDLKTSTLRVYVDVKDVTATEDVEKTAESAFKAIQATLPLNTYFKGSAGAKMYDLEIHVYTVADKDDSNFDYYILTRNSNTQTEDGYVLDHVSVAKDPELAAKLRGEVDEVVSDGTVAPTDDAVDESTEKE